MFLSDAKCYILDFKCPSKALVLKAESPAWLGGGGNSKRWGLMEDLLVTGGVPLKGIAGTPLPLFALLHPIHEGGSALLCHRILTMRCFFATEPKAIAPINHGPKPSKL
jgi:hypothetical protein